MLKKMLLMSLFVPALVLATDPASSSSSSSSSSAASTTSEAIKPLVADKSKETDPLAPKNTTGSEAGQTATPAEPTRVDKAKSWIKENKWKTGIFSFAFVAAIAAVGYKVYKNKHQENSNN